MQTTGFRSSLPLVISGFLISFFVVGGGIDTVSVFLNALAKQMHWTHSSLSLGVSTGAISAALSTPFVGVAVDRFGVRVPILAGVVLLTVGFLIVVSMTKPWHFAAANVFLGMGFGACALLPVTVAVTVMIPQGTALALGIIGAGSSTGALVLAPLMQLLIEHFGWRGTYLVLGMAVVLTPIPLLLFALPRGRLRQPAEQAAGKRATSGTSVWRDLTRPGVGGLAIVMLLPALAGFSVSVHLVPYLTSMDYTGAAAAAALGGTIGISALGKVVGGWIADRTGALTTLRIAFILWILALVLLQRASGLVGLWGFTILYGLAFGTQIAVIPPIAVRLLNPERFGALFGIMQLAAMVASAIGPVASGIIYDKSGNYGGALLLWIAAIVIATVVSFTLRTGPSPAPATESAIG